MAIWQFDFYIIPKNRMDNITSEENIISWKWQKNDVSKVDFLQQTECWSKDILQYGNVDSTCIQYVYENEKLEEILCRIDLRSITNMLINKIVDYMASINSIIYYDGCYVLPTYENIVKEIKQSRAFSFCKNPSEFLDNYTIYKEYGGLSTKHDK